MMNGMVENEIKKLVIGQLLEMLKIGFNTGNVLPKGGSEFKTISSLENEIFNAVKSFANMPEEENGVFVADKYVAIAFDYASGNSLRDEAVNKILNWKSDSVDVVGEDAEKKNSQC
jgi:hypothetical protein